MVLLTSDTVFQAVSDLVGKLPSPDGVPSFAGASGVASLNHETFDVAVKQAVLERWRNKTSIEKK